MTMRVSEYLDSDSAEMYRLLDELTRQPYPVRVEMVKKYRELPINRNPSKGTKRFLDAFYRLMLLEDMH